MTLTGCKRIFPVLLALLMLLTLSLQAFAAGYIDLGKEGSLTISYTDEKKPLTDVKFDLYLVATLSQNGDLTPTEAFKNFRVNLFNEKGEAWKELATTLEGYVLRDGIQPTLSGHTDKNGKLSFSNPEKGLYLLLGERHTQYDTIYEPSASMILFPTQEGADGVWNYDVTVYPKSESRPLPPPEDDDTISRKVLKVWEDKGHKKERPKFVVIQLLRNGKVYDTVKLSEDNNWRYRWDDLDEDYRWTVVEKELDDYTVTVTKEGITFVVTNTYDEEPETPPDKPNDPELPQTGVLWWPVIPLVVGGLLLIVLGLYRRKQYYKDHDK